MATTIPTMADAISPPGELVIDLFAIQENWRRLSARAGATETGAVVKADAYGLGVEEVAGALWDAGAHRFYVAQTGEGLRVRELLPDATVVVLAPVLPEALSVAWENKLVLTLNNPEALEHWRKINAWKGDILPVMIHFDTGMTRLGFDVSEAAALWEGLSPIEAAGVVEVSSHLACADEPDHPANRSQLERFQAATRGAPAHAIKSLANSSGIFLGAPFLHSGQRPGMALYGLNPTPGRPNPMRRVVGLKGRILQTRRLQRAESVGYGGTATLPKGATVATIAAGYADGLHRALSNRGAVWIGGHRAPVIGRVSMDLIAVDVSKLPEAMLRTTQYAEILSDKQDADALAAGAGTIGYEILTSLGGRYRRVYLLDEPESRS